MNIDNMTIGEAKQLSNMFSVSGSGEQNRMIGKKVIIRGYASGVHFGELVSQDGQKVVLKDARRLWKWFAIGGISLSEVSQNGVNTSKSRICETVPDHTILDAIEILGCTDKSSEIIQTAIVYQP